MSLIDDMILLNAWADAIGKGTHEMTEDGWRVFSDRLKACTDAVIKLGELAANVETDAPPCGVDPLEGDRVASKVIRFPGERINRREEASVLGVLEEMHRICVEEAKAGAIGPPDGGDAA